MHAVVSLRIAAAAMLCRAFASVNSLYKPAQPVINFCKKIREVL